MSTYINLSSTLINPMKDHIDDEWVKAHDTNFLYREILSRGGYLLLTPACMIVVALDTIIGLGSAILSLATLGLSRDIVDLTTNHLGSTRKIVTLVFIGLLKTVNPHAVVPDADDQNGFLTDPLFKKIHDLAYEFKDSDSYLAKYLGSRVTLAISPFIVAIGRVADMALSLVAVTFSFATLGMIDKVNEIACYSLEFPSVPIDLIECAILCINPFAVDGS